MPVKAITFCTWLILGAVNVEPILVGAQSLPKVVIGYPASSIASIQLFIAQEKGFFIPCAQRWYSIFLFSTR